MCDLKFLLILPTPLPQTSEVSKPSSLPSTSMTSFVDFPFFYTPYKTIDFNFVYDKKGISLKKNR